MKRSLAPTSLIVTAALFLGACGSDGDFSDTASVDTIATATESTSTTSAAEIEPGKDGSVDGITRLWIKPDLVDCVGEAPQKCMQVAESEDGEHFFFYDQIEGFTFEVGTTYILDVLVEEIPDPPADASSLKYTLVSIVSVS